MHHFNYHKNTNKQSQEQLFQSILQQDVKLIITHLPQVLSLSILKENLDCSYYLKSNTTQFLTKHTRTKTKLEQSKHIFDSIRFIKTTITLNIRMPFLRIQTNQSFRSQNEQSTQNIFICRYIFCNMMTTKKYLYPISDLFFVM